MGATYSAHKKREKIINELRFNGHSCIKITNNYPIEFTWCENDRCIENMRMTQSFMIYPEDY